MSGKTFPLRLTLMLTAVFALAFGLSVLMGFLGAPRHESFSWEIASIFGTAAGTTLLAFATFLLNHSTSTRSREATEAAIRPLLAEDATPMETTPLRCRRVTLKEGGSKESLRVEVDALRNVGNGPAFITDVVPRQWAEDWGNHATHTSFFRTVVAPGERFAFTVDVGGWVDPGYEYFLKQFEDLREPSNHDEASLQHWYTSPVNNIVVDVFYTDASGRQPQRTSVRVVRDQGQSPLIVEFGLANGQPLRDYLILHPIIEDPPRPGVGWIRASYSPRSKPRLPKLFRFLRR